MIKIKKANIMQNGYYQAVGGMVTQFNRLDLISNNLANTNTIGYKREDSIIGDFISIYKNARDKLPLQNDTKDAAKFVNRTLNRVPRVISEYIDFSSGGMKKTSNPLDLALKRDDRFFLVDTGNGIKMTQNGAFTLNENGELVTKEGYKVLSSSYFQTKRLITLPPNSDITISPNGAIYANGESVAKLFIAKYNNDRSDLKRVGDTLYDVKNINDISQSEDGDWVAEGYLQTSNINPVKEMVALIETNRLVEMYQKAMTSQMNDVNGDAINKIANTRA